MSPKALLERVVVLYCLVLAVVIPEAMAAEVGVILPNGVSFKKEVKSLKEARYKNMIPQKYDLSCGAAALATILTYYYDDPVDEAQVITYMLKHGDQSEIAKKGFSLLDLKRYAEARNYMAAGYKNVKLENLKKLKIPAIILFKVGRYDHFVVLRGIQEDRAFIADPAFGNRSINLEDFEKEWNQVVFLVATKKGEVTKDVPVASSLKGHEMNVTTLQSIGALSGFSVTKPKGEF
ncbi:MAG: C39 family peptidase [bacterium]